MICAAVAGAFTPPPGPVAQSASVRLGPHGRAVLRSLNHVRAAHHLPSLFADRRMDRVASRYSHLMAHHSSFSHGPWTRRVAHAAGRAHALGEVLGWLTPARPHTEASRVVRAWMHSPEHRRVLLDGSLRRVGLGRAVGAEFGTRAAVYTVDFASAG